MCVGGPALGSDPIPITRNDFGQVGLIEMPSARMAPDGDLSFNASYFEKNQRYNLGFQFFPWMEAIFKYSGLDHYDPAYPVYWDRSLSMKIRLSNESGDLPAISVGSNDLLGTGLFSGEYVVASKQVGNFDASLGLGWGRLATADPIKNPLCALSNSFCTRGLGSGITSQGGQFNFSQYFRGKNIGIFGGLNWTTPVDGLTVQVEYSSDNYVAEHRSGNFNPRSQFNFGATYQLTDSLQVGLSYNYGSSLAARITAELDPVHAIYPAKIAPPLPPPTLRTAEQQNIALNNLLQSRETRVSGAAAELAQQHISEMVDAFFRNGVEDVRVAGRQILLVGSNKGGASECRKYADLASSYPSDFDALVLLTRTVPEHVIAHCAIPMRPKLVQAVAWSTRPLSVSSSPLIIDGVSGAPATPQQRSASKELIRKDLAAQKISTDALEINTSEITLYYTNAQYFTEDEAVGRIIRILMKDAPTDIEKFRLIAVVLSVPTRELDILRGPMERAFDQADSNHLVGTAISQAPAPLNNPVLSAADEETFPRFSWTIYPQFRQALFDPATPLGIQFVGVLGGGVELARGLAINGDVEGSLYDNFYTQRKSNSVLPHVRTDFTQYFTRGKNGIDDMQLGYVFRITPTVYAFTRAGYLESMFAGGGGEVLWRPEGERWAIGADAYQVWQRGFDRLFDLQPYKAFTGHVSLYYDSPWYGLNFAIRAGQYLAKDRGVTLEVSRQFSTGVTIGVFATKTNVSSAQFGEGSFDKGIFLSIPLEWALPVATQTELNEIIRPIQRDGGQRLQGDAVLYGMTDRTGTGNILQHSDQFIAH
jgi:hypothetical protein